MAVNQRRTGAYGAVSANGSAVKAISNWAFNEANTMQSLVNSATLGGTFQQTGIHDWNGTFTSDDPEPILWPGDSFDFIGYITPTTGVLGTAGICYEGPAYLEQLQITIDVANNTPIRNLYTFNGNGPWAQTSEIVRDTAHWDPVFSQEVTYTLSPKPSGSTDDTCYLNLQTLTITLSRPSASTVDNCLVDLSSGKPLVWTGRQAGSNFTCNASATLNTVEQQFLPAIDTPFSLQLGWRTANHWLFNFMLRENQSGPTVDPSAGTVFINNTLAMQWTALTIGETENTLGEISYESNKWFPPSGVAP